MKSRTTKSSNSWMILSIQPAFRSLGFRVTLKNN